MTNSNDDSLATADARLKYWELRRKRILQRNRARQRKDDTRTKIIIGGAALHLIKNGEAESFRNLINYCIATATDRDRRLVVERLREHIEVLNPGISFAEACKEGSDESHAEAEGDSTQPTESRSDDEIAWPG